jgi:hypothetical protein
MTAYPLSVKVSGSTLGAWREDELGSFEDHGGPADHVHELLGRRRTVLEIRSRDELEAFIVSAEHHASSWDDRHAYRAAVGRIAATLRGLR